MLRALTRHSIRTYQTRQYSKFCSQTICGAGTKPTNPTNKHQKMEASASSAATAAVKVGVEDSYYVPRCKLQISTPFPPPYGDMEKHVIDIVEHGISAVSASHLVRQNIRVANNMLYVRDRRYSLHQNVHVIAFGKAVLGMTHAVDELLSDHIVRGISVVPTGTLERVREIEMQAAERSGQKNMFLLRSGSRIRVMEGALNNLPDEAAMRAAIEAKKLAQSLTDNDLLIVLITGGGSSLLPLPVEAISLEEQKQISQLLSKSGANIYDLNAVRKQFSQLKGGKLVELASPAKVISFVLSDVIGDALEYIASGPTMIDTSSSASHALDILRHYDLLGRIPPRALAYLESKASQEASAAEANSMKGQMGPGSSLIDGFTSNKKNTDQLSTSESGAAGAGEDPRAAISVGNTMSENRQSRLELMQYNVQNVVIGNNRLALEGAAAYAQQQLGYEPYVLSSNIGGTVENAALLFSKLCILLNSWYEYSAKQRDHLSTTNTLSASAAASPADAAHCDDTKQIGKRADATQTERGTENSVAVDKIVDMRQFVNALVQQQQQQQPTVISRSAVDGQSTSFANSSGSEEQAITLSRTELELVRCGIKKEQLNELLRAAHQAFLLGRPLCILAGGEITVNLRSESQQFAVGMGGRCMHLSTVMARRLFDLSRSTTVNKLGKTRLAFQFCAVGTDGQDGPTPGAGAYVNPLTLPNAVTPDHDERQVLNSCDRAIENFDSFNWLSNHMNGRFLLRYAYTDSNVMDLYALLVTRYEAL